MNKSRKVCIESCPSDSTEKNANSSMTDDDIVIRYGDADEIVGLTVLNAIGRS